MSPTRPAIGIDIGGTKTVVAVVELSGQIRSRVEAGLAFSETASK